MRGGPGSRPSAGPGASHWGSGIVANMPVKVWRERTVRSWVEACALHADILDAINEGKLGMQRFRGDGVLITAASRGNVYLSEYDRMPAWSSEPEAVYEIILYD